MTSEIETLKTNEFLRRRKLRIQQVREQSKDIAKKIRQRTKSELFRQRTDVDELKEREFLQRQEKIVKRLEELYVKGINNIGAGHKNAAEEGKHDPVVRVDLSKLRGREAVAELRRRKEENLIEKNKLLARKLQAREIANEISRDKSSTVANKLSTKVQTTDQHIEGDTIAKSSCEDNDNKGLKVTKSDMATQWDLDGLVNEWAPSVPELVLPKDDKDSVKDSSKENEENRSEKSKRLDLFALSDEMPSSLRGGLVHIPEETVPMKPSLTLVSEYIQNRVLNLRDSNVSNSQKQIDDDLKTIKQTILKTRTSCLRGSSDKNLCHVVDGEMLPVPPWQAENNCQTHPSVNSYINHGLNSTQFKSTNSKIHPVLSPNPIIRGTSPFRRNRFYCGTRISSDKNTHSAKLTKSSLTEGSQTKKPSVTIYNHITKDSRNILHSDESVVVRDTQTDEDAYSRAVRESALDNSKDREHKQRIADMRNKAAMDKKSVEKEYHETIAFLNSLPKDKNKPIKTAYMDERSQKARKESQQRRLQQEYNTIERQCKKRATLDKKYEDRANYRRCNSTSPTKPLNDVDRDFQYSWLPVPEGDGNLAIHTIPTTIKGKPGNSVKFSDIDSYHEYRSRHKHTPPTKEKVTDNRKNFETIFVEENSETSETSTVNSDTSSVENLRVKSSKERTTTKDLSDAEKIIIYRILESKREKRKIKRTMKDAAKSVDSVSENIANNEGNNNRLSNSHEQADGQDIEIINKVEELNEGVYKTVSEKGDNITSMYFCNKKHDGDKVSSTEEDVRHDRPCCFSKKLSRSKQRESNTGVTWDINATPPERVSTICKGCKCGCASLKSDLQSSSHQPSATTSTSSFKTAHAAAVVSNVVDNGFLSDARYIKVAGDNNQEAGKFYIGASGFLKEDNYEVIIQLRKKDVSKETKDDKKEDVVSEKPIKKSLGNNDSITASKTVLEDKEVTNQETQHDANIKQPDVEILNDVALSSNNSENNICKNKESDKQDNSGNQPAFEKSVGVVEYIDASVNLAVSSSQLYNPMQDKMLPTSVSKFVSTACTQTSFSSPNSRHIHLSSSTSTAYMSPPEIILPRFLKDGYNYKDIYDRRGGEYSKNRHTESETSNRKGYSKGCNHKQCSHSKNIFISKSKTTNTRHVELTPPSTGQSNVSDYYGHNYDQMHSKRPHSSPNTQAFICSCRRAAAQVHSKQCVKAKVKKQDCPSKTKQFLRNSSILHRNSVMNHEKKSTNNIKKKAINLDPSLKLYISKLLTLNNEGLKAIEVVNQECSAVTTPGSSVINVPNNITNQKDKFNNKISLEQIKSRLIKHIYDEVEKQKSKTDTSNSKDQTEVNFRKFPHRIFKPKKVHKVKSLNISKRMLKVTKKPRRTVRNLLSSVPLSSSSLSSRDYSSDKNCRVSVTKEFRNKNRSKSSPSPRQFEYHGSHRNTETMIGNNIFPKIKSKGPAERAMKQKREEIQLQLLFNKATTTASNTPSTSAVNKKLKSEIDHKPVNNSTQTNHGDDELDFLKLAEDKLQNMEKIANLTERCTKRLSNLAKVLEDVRRNKSLAYSQISTSDSTSDSDHKAVKDIVPETSLVNYDLDDVERKRGSDDPSISDRNGIDKINVDTSTNYVPFIVDIPKSESPRAPILETCTETTLHVNVEQHTNKESNPKSPRTRGKPPPALSRVSLKNCLDYIVPHELSTVLEVESPMSVKNKHTSSRNCYKVDNVDSPNTFSTSLEDLRSDNKHTLTKNSFDNVNSDVLHRNLNIKANKEITSKKIDDSKLQMIDLKHFNEIMLKPFITLKEYEKQNIKNVTDEGSNVENGLITEIPNDDISSLHSDGSLPDVIAELIKRNIINEPFKFDSASNVNSTSVSSDSTLSMLALSKAQIKKRPQSMFQNKENIDTSESLSVSSNADLEIAFKKLGMGWASSTLKKTKERLALSSSSNTSSSSLSQFKTKGLVRQDIPELESESVSSILHVPKKKEGTPKRIDNSKNAEQQTLLTNSMTVKEFLTNELAKKITFTSNSNKSDKMEEFVSLYETNIPEEIKYPKGQDIRPESTASNNRARTSTPVRIYKSQAYHSSSSSNLSNGLFSNVEDLSSVKGTSNSMRNHSTSDKDDLTIPNYSLKIKKVLSDCSKSD